MKGLPGPVWPAGTPSASELTLPAANGKHPSLRCHLYGTVVTAAAQSKRLLFFSVDAVGEPCVQWRCIAKVADGYLSPAQIAELTVRLQPGATVCLLAFPELAPADCTSGDEECDRQAWLHVMSYLLCKPRETPSAAAWEQLGAAMCASADRVPSPAAPCVSAVDGDGETPSALQTSPALQALPAPDSASVAPRLGRRARREAGEGPSRVRPNNGARHQVFVGWLVNTFGQERLQRGGVLDIAGGAGCTAFELTFRRSIACTVVDPRPITANARQRRSLRCRRRYQDSLGTGEGGMGAAGERSDIDAAREKGDEDVEYGTGGTLDSGSATAAGPGEEPHPVSTAADHLRAASIFGSEAHREAGAVIAPALVAVAREEGMEDRALLPYQLLERFDETFIAGPARRLWELTEVIIGFHPDEATELLVDAALAHRKPFACIPCCVFPKANASRRTPDGLPVISHEQFIEYLAAKHPAIRRTRLAKFEGRNIVLWYDPELEEEDGGGRVAQCEACE